YAPRLPRAGETIHGHKFVTNFGGKGHVYEYLPKSYSVYYDFANNINFKVGDDVWGPKYIANLESLQVNTQYVKTTENSSSGIAQINVADNGMNQIIIVAGANQRLNLKDIEDAESIISSADVLVLQLETPVETAIRALQLAKGVSILNGAPAIETFNEELLRLPSIFCVNESEASIFSGLPVNNPNEAETAAKELIAKGCQSVLITLGEDGAIFLTSDPNVPVFKADAPQVKSADTTGAGDAFIGALAFCLANLKEFSIQQAIKAACIVAADSVTRLGTQISFPGEEILIRIV
ncbi:hypothetical protein HUJ05_010492, partial [Dendroctonus ponderosae]